MKVILAIITSILITFTTTPKIYSQWVYANGPYGGSVNCFFVNDSNIYAGTGSGVWGATESGLPTGSITASVWCLTAIGTTLFAGTDTGVFRLTDSGRWTWASDGLPSYSYIEALAVSDTNLFAGTEAGVFLSTNKGTSWVSSNAGLGTYIVRTFAISGTNFLAGVYNGGGIFRSTNKGANWNSANNGIPPNVLVYQFASIGNALFAATDSGVFRTTDTGSSWTITNLHFSADGIVAYGSTLFAATDGVEFSTDEGVTWNQIENGYMPSSVHAIVVYDTSLFAASTGSGIWSHSLLGLNAVSEKKNTSLSLACFPNPATTSTRISYSIPQHSDVLIEAFDVIGRSVAQIMSGTKDAGAYEAMWDTNLLPAGSYIIRLTAGGESVSKVVEVVK